jgi:hypothetical protein
MHFLPQIPESGAAADARCRTTDFRRIVSRQLEIAQPRRQAAGIPANRINRTSLAPKRRPCAAQRGEEFLISC